MTITQRELQQVANEIKTYVGGTVRGHLQNVLSKMSDRLANFFINANTKMNQLGDKADRNNEHIIALAQSHTTYVNRSNGIFVSIVDALASLNQKLDALETDINGNVKPHIAAVKADLEHIIEKLTNVEETPNEIPGNEEGSSGL